MNKSKERYQNPELPFACLMVEKQHSHETTDSAKQRCEKQYAFPNTPSVINCPALVKTKQDKGDDRAKA
jgi:hypothetical protein